MTEPLSSACERPAAHEVPHPPTVVVVGAGFSGAAVAVQLVRQARKALRVLLVNGSGPMGRGLAYGTRSHGHLLNVPAGNMSALADDPDDFLRYCRWSAPAVQAQSFVSRQAYGAYLEALLAAAEASPGSLARLERLTGTVVAATPCTPAAPPGAALVRLQLDDGRVLDAHQVVLAFGHFPPASPWPAEALACLGPRWIADPWAPRALDSIQPTDPVVLVGTGLTAVDMALALQDQGHTGPITCVSRRGLMPQAHRASGGLAHAVDGQRLAAAFQGGLRAGLRALREATAAHEAAGGDWRDAIGALRAHTPALWAGLGQTERRQFLRHLRPHWDVLRHRCAPQAHQRFEQLRQSGQLRCLAARLLRADTASDGTALLHLQPRSGGAPLVVAAAHAVNCTGPSSDLRRSRCPLMAQLCADGLLQADALGLGLAVDAQGQPLGRNGQVSPWLHYIGPLLKARDWEAVAVPELRQHAQRLATRLLQTWEAQTPSGG